MALPFITINYLRRKFTKITLSFLDRFIKTSTEYIHPSPRILFFTTIVLPILSGMECPSLLKFENLCVVWTDPLSGANVQILYWSDALLFFLAQFP